MCFFPPSMHAVLPITLSGTSGNGSSYDPEGTINRTAMVEFSGLAGIRLLVNQLTW